MTIYALDLESSGLDFWSPNFVLKSLALAWEDEFGRLETRFYDDMDYIEAALDRIKDETILVYNASFDIGVIRALFPHLEPKNWIDVMRLRQLRSPVEKKEGYGLKAAVKVFLPGMAGYEQKYYEHLKTQFPDVPAKKLGKHLGDLPRALLAEYNTHDTIATLKLYRIFTAYFENEVGFDWTRDHTLYRRRVSAVIDGKLYGVIVDRKQLSQYISDTEAEIASIDSLFMTKFAEEIETAREIIRDLDLWGGNKIPGEKRIANVMGRELPVFNTASKRHLEILFCFVLGLEPAFKTTKGGPSMKAAHLGFYGKPGKMLEKRGKRVIVKGQAEGIMERSAIDGKYHIDLKVVGTKSGRLAGNGGSNVQGLSRSEKGLMSSFVAPKGYLYIESDLSAGEPRIIAHYTKDLNYTFVNLDSPGEKIREVEVNGKRAVLLKGDPYLTLMSISGAFTEDFWNVYENGIGGRTFRDLWETDPETVKEALKKGRKLNKMMALALGYSAQPPKIKEACKMQGNVDISIEQAQAAYDAFWALFANMKKFIEGCKQKCKRSDGVVINEFGYRMYPKNPNAAFNGLIQSSVSSAMDLLLWFFQENYPQIEFKTVIHDAFIFLIKEEFLEEYKKAAVEATDFLNNLTGWSAKFKLGCSVGRTWAELK